MNLPPPFVAYWRSLRAAVPTLVLISAVGAGIAYAWAARQGVTYQVHFSYIVALSEREASHEYRFDGYYALQATELFAKTLARLAVTPETIVAAYSAAGVELPSHDPYDLTRTITATASAPQLVEITIKDRSKTATQKLAAGLQEVLNDQVERYHDQGIPAVRFRVVASQPWVGEARLNIPLIVVATFVFLFLFGVNVVFLWLGLQRHEHSH